MNIKDKITFFYYWEETLWDDQVDANKYFATLSILFAAIVGALTGGGNTLKSMFNLETEMSLYASLGLCVFIWGYNVAESIVATTNAKTAFLRSLLMLFCIAVAYGLGHLLAVVVIVVVTVILVLLVGWGVLKAALGGSSSGGKTYLVDKDGNKEEVSRGLIGTDLVDKQGHSYQDNGNGTATEIG